jgi:hypothetical protein
MSAQATQPTSIFGIMEVLGQMQRQLDDIDQRLR